MPVAERTALTYFAIASILVAASSAWCPADTPAFPGAQGGGAAAVGGRGGRVIEVTNLNAAGPGSLRAACEAKGQRIVTFRVSGIIDLAGKAITIRNPYITIAGQTAPGGGVIIRGHELGVAAHDVIVRFIRVRTGRRDEFHNQEGDCIALTSNCRDIMIDHCSASWSNDENMQIWSGKTPAHRVTFSWNLIAEGLTYNHGSCGLIVGSNEDAVGIHAISIHHNLFMHGNNRFPLVKCRDARIISNIMYNWTWWPTGIAGGIRVDIIGNRYKPGPDTKPSNLYEVQVRSDWDGPNYGPPGKPSIFINGNLGPHQDNPKGDNWPMLMLNDRWRPLGRQPDRAACERAEPMPASPYPITVHPVSDIETEILPDVGASRRLDENGNWVANRDAVDLRLVKEYTTGTGTIPKDENSVGGYPTLAPGTPYPDGDHDGMPDAYEKKHGFDPSSPTDGPADADGDGYTNIEEFLNGTNPRAVDRSD